MVRFKYDIERLTSARLADVDALSEQLHTHLGNATRQGLRNERTAERGMLGGLELRNITLRSPADNPDQATLSFDVAPPSVALKEILWDGAILYPARPDAPDSRAYWSAQLNGAEVVFGLAADQLTLTYVSIIQH